MANKAPLAGYIDPNFPNPNGPADAPIIIYGYTPSLAVGLLGVILFSISAIMHAYQLFRHKTWWFTPIMVGTIMEVVGYVFRILSSQVDPYHVIYFVIQYFFIVVAPVFFSAGIYTILSVLINRLGRQFAPLSPRLILIIFIICDVVSTGVQIAGAALIGKAESNRKDPTTPNNILLAGLSFQVFSFFLFLVLTSTFLWRARHATGVMEKHNSPRGVKKSFLFAFGVATAAVYLRTCFRLAETAEGLYGKLSTHEVFFGCLEFAPVAIAVVLFNIWHPGRCIPQY